MLHVSLLVRDHQLIVAREAVAENGDIAEIGTPVAPHDAIVQTETAVRHVKQGVLLHSALAKIVRAQHLCVEMDQNLRVRLSVKLKSGKDSVNRWIKHFDGLLDVKQRVEF